MIKQIFKQLWFYRRSNAWLFVEMTLIVAASWFLVNAVWPYQYRSHLPDGYDTERVYVLTMSTLYEGQDGYDPASASAEKVSADFHRFGNALRSMPEILDAAPAGTTLPGLSMMNFNTSTLIDTVRSVYFAYHAREAGTADLSLLGYRQVWPENGPVEDLPGTVIITSDLADIIWPGENPVGKQFGEAEQLGGSWRVSGVIEPVKIIKDQEYRSFVMFANADITKDQNEIEPVWCFRLRPGVDEDAFITDASRTWKEQMRYGNYRVGSILSLDDTLRRETVDNFTWQALFIFLLICMLIGVASFSWLRTRERRGEIGVRRAMGGTAGSVMLTLLCEVWSLYAVSLLTGLLLVINTIVIGKIDFCSSGMYIGFVSQPIVDSLPLIFEPVPHFLVVAGIAALILLAAVTLSTIVPVAGALKESPADVLKDE